MSFLVEFIIELSMRKFTKYLFNTWILKTWVFFKWLFRWHQISLEINTNKLKTVIVIHVIKRNVISNRWLNSLKGKVSFRVVYISGSNLCLNYESYFKLTKIDLLYSHHVSKIILKCRIY